MKAAAPLRGISVLPIGGSLADGMARPASLEVRALITEWIPASQRYFRALQDLADVPADSPDRPEVEATADAAIPVDEDVRRRIVDMRSIEPGAMALKVAAALAHMRDRGGVDAVIADRLRVEGPSEDLLALAVLRDLAEALGPTVKTLAKAGCPERWELRS